MVTSLFRLPIKVKLPAILSFLFIVTLAGSGIIYSATSNTRENVREITTHIIGLKNTTLALERVVRNVELHLLYTFVLKTDKYFKTIAEDSERVDYLINQSISFAEKMQANGDEAQYVETLNRVKSEYDQIYIQVKELLALYSEGKPDEAEKEFRSVQIYFTQLNTGIDSVSGFAQISFEKKNDMIYDQTRTIQISLLVFICVSLIAFVLVMIILFMAILRPIGIFNRTLQQLTTGDLTTRFPLPKVNCSEVMQCDKEDCPEHGQDDVHCFFTVGSMAPDFGRENSCPAITSGKLKSCTQCQVYKKICRDEITTLEAYFNYFVHSLHTMIIDTKAITGEISEIADNLSDSSNDAFTSIEMSRKNIVEIQAMINFLNTEVARSDKLSEEVKKQAETVSSQIGRQSADVEKSSASIEQMNANIHTVAGNTEDKITLIHNLADVADSGKEEMKNTISLIREIASSTNVIQDMVAVIDNITAKTNLLAMNAAIEAAHAGDAGKGFSVVAGEIRKLAENTNKNSRQISDSLMKIIESIEASEGSGNKTGDYFDNIVAGISGVSGSILEIKNAMSELSVGSSQITQALSSLLESSTHVLDSSNDMKASVERINKSLMDINTKSTDINGRATEITGAISHIYEMAKLISQAGVSNNKAVEKISSHLSRFKT